MADNAPFTDEEIARLRELLEIDAIRKTKMLYSQLMDSRETDALADIFTEDALCEFGPYGKWEGRETIRKNYHEVLNGTIKIPFGAMHNTNNHWVELTSATTAVGRSYLIDVVTHTPADENPIVWFGLYDESYRKVDGQWQISRCTLQFFWPERHITGDFPEPYPPGRG